ncbi:MAG: hypothetical protein Q7K26_00290 [bacterium]|nr:hypothetical protein [bacterium]
MNALPIQPTSNWRNKVPEVTAFFWIIKMMSTTVGETAADFLNADLHLGLTFTSAVMAALLVIALFFQIQAKRYIPSRYWVAVVFISVFGTLITDNLSDNLGVPLSISTGLFGFALIATFFVWYRQEKTLSIHAIDSTKRELFYWTAILFTFALGTAAGDLIAEGLNLGYANSALLFGGLIVVAAFAHYVFKANAVACFWIAYVLTRPFGASCGDLLSQSVTNGGLGLGTVGTSALFLVTIVALVAYLSVVQKRLPE